MPEKFFTIILGILLCSAVLCLFPSCSFAQEAPRREGLTLDAGLWPVAISGTLTSQNQTANLKDDLGYSASTPFYVSVQGPSGKGHNRMQLNYCTLNASSTVNSGRSYTYSNATINAGNSVSSDLRLNHIEGVYAWDLSHEDNGARYALLLGLRFVDYYSNVRNVTLNQSVTQSGSIAVPEIGMQTEFTLGRHVKGLADFKWMDISSGSGRGSLFDYSVGLDCELGDRLDIRATYSYERLYARDNSNSCAELVLQGPRVLFRYNF